MLPPAVVSVGEIDCTFLLRGTLGESPRDPDYFRQARVDPEARTVVWPEAATRLAIIL